MKQLLLLDIDHTLLLALENGRTVKYENVKVDVVLENLNIYKRPYLDYTLNKLNEVYNLGLWTTGNIRYCLKIKELFFDTINIPLQYTLSQHDCDFDAQGAAKDISIIKEYDKKDILFLDDNEFVQRRNLQNWIRIPKFDGNPSDNCLKRILRRLIP